jgi:hypothetical protein
MDIRDLQRRGHEILRLAASHGATNNLAGILTPAFQDIMMLE